MSTYSNRLQPVYNLLQRVVRFFHPRMSCTMHISVDVFGGRKSLSSNVAENLQLYWVVQFFHPRSSCTTTHISADVQRIILMRCAWRSRVEEPNNLIYSATSLSLRVISQFHSCGTYSVPSRSHSIIPMLKKMTIPSFIPMYLMKTKY